MFGKNKSAFKLKLIVRKSYIKHVSGIFIFVAKYICQEKMYISMALKTKRSKGDITFTTSPLVF